MNNREVNTFLIFFTAMVVAFFMVITFAGLTTEPTITCGEQQ